MMPQSNRSTRCRLDIRPGEGIGPLHFGASRRQLSQTVIAGCKPELVGRCLQWSHCNLRALFNNRSTTVCSEISINTGHEHGTPLPRDIDLVLYGTSVRDMRLQEARALLRGRALDLVTTGSAHLGIRFGGYESEDEWVGFWRVTPRTPLEVPILAGHSVGCLHLDMDIQSMANLPVCLEEAQCDADGLHLPRHGISCRVDVDGRCSAIDVLLPSPASTNYHLRTPISLNLGDTDFSAAKERLSTYASEILPVGDATFLLFPREGLRLGFTDGCCSIRICAPQSHWLQGETCT
ncbi:MAG: hypothetical protein ACOCXA_03740 [Planctomycetota bacterium]